MTRMALPPRVGFDRRAPGPFPRSDQLKRDGPAAQRRRLHAQRPRAFRPRAGPRGARIGTRSQFHCGVAGSSVARSSPAIFEQPRPIDRCAIGADSSTWGGMASKAVTKPR